MKQVYLLKSDYTGYYKIGVSKNPKKRVKQLETGTSENIDVLNTFSTDIAYKVENALHNFFQVYKINREWYDLPLEIELSFLEHCEKIEKNLKIIAGNFE